MVITMEQAHKKRWIKIVQVVAILLLCMDVYSRLFSHPRAINVPTPNVAVVKPKRLPVMEYITQTGNIVAFNSVNLVARVEGYLEQIHFVFVLISYP